MSPRRAGGFAGALSVAAMTVGAAPAHADPAPSIEVADPRVSFGDEVTATGAAPAATVGSRVALEFRAHGAEPWRQVATGLVRSSGRFRLHGPVTRSGTVRIRLGAAAGGGELLSRERRVRVLAGLVVRTRHLQVLAGSRVGAAGRVRPGRAGLVVALQIFKGGRWATLDTDRTGQRGSYAVADRRRATMSARVRVRVSARPIGLGTAIHGLGRADVYRRASASWYGPGLYGNHLGCGGRLSAGSLGVAHKHLPCGTLVTFRRAGRSVRVPVIDRGPYVGGREYDLTAATARRLGFRGHGPILATR